MTHPLRDVAGAAGRTLLRPLLACGLVLAALPAAAAATAGSLYDFGARPEWVDVATPEYAAEIGNDGLYDGAAVLLFDRQVDVTAAGDEYYEHFAVRVANSTGIDAWSQIDISVDPGYQVLRIHSLQVVRDGKVIDQRELARITATPQENDLRNRIYNGRYDVDVLFADVRPGDVIEYDYTISSREQLFPGHFSTKLYTGWSQPVLEQRIRILAPRERPLRFRLSNGEVPLVPATHGDVQELFAVQRHVATIPGDPDRPGWYDPWPFLEATDYASWADVTRAVSPLFELEAGERPRVAGLVAKIRAGGGTPQEQALRALQFVQDEIAYASISIGRGTHEPADPEVVLERRYGDCKDKALLLATVLGRLGIEAQPALVNTTLGRALDDALPTPYAFDHAIVRARIDGSDYWLDATAPKQYSPLDPADPPDYERALPVHTAEAGLAVIPEPAPDTRGFDLLMEFDFGDGLEAPASLTMTTRYEGRMADDMRVLLQRGSPEQRQVNYTNYIASYYSGATAAAPIEIEDDPSRNVVEVREFYTLPRAFTRGDDDALELFLHADELYEYGEPLEHSIRQAPLALEYPIHAHQKLVVHLPRGWNVAPEVVTVEDPAFRYRGEVAYSSRTLTLDYDYLALADHVPVENLARYQQNRSRFYDDVGYRLTSTSGGSEAAAGLAPVPVAAMLLSLVLGGWAAVRGWRWDPEPKPAGPDAPRGIRGWLLLPALGVVVVPCVLAWAARVWGGFAAKNVWEAAPGLARDGWEATAHAGILFCQAGSVLLFVMSLLLAALFFRKRTSAPAMFVAFNLAVWLWGSALQVWLILSGLDTETTPAELTGGLVRDSLPIFIWTIYMVVSRRVKATFVNRLAPRATAAQAVAA